ncbi:MAG: hypothetical protein AAGF45_12300 [Pseudomonadota bacterium]
MSQYQNIFTRIQVVGPHDEGIEIPEHENRTEKSAISILLGRIGNAQVGPIYLGYIGIASMVCFAIGFSIIGFNMLASVDWNPLRFVTELLWLSLDPPLREHGLKVLPPLQEGGWWLLAGFFITTA